MPTTPSECQNSAAPELHLANWLKAILNLRKRRDSLFGADLFSDHSWEILLVLAGCQGGKGLGLGQLAKMTDRSEATTTRWLNILIDRGHVRQDEGAQFRLTREATEKLVQVLG